MFRNVFSEGVAAAHVRPSQFFNKPAETMDRKEIEQTRDKLLRWTVNHAYSNNALYRKKMDAAGVKPDDIKTASDIHKLPFTTKDELRSLYPFGILAVPRNQILEVHATSGTTGVPTLGFYTKNDIEVWGEVSGRSLVMSGLTKDDVFQITPSFGMFTGGFGFYYGARRVGAMIVPTGAGFSKRQIQYMIDFGTTMVSAVVSYILRLTETAFEMGVDPAKDTKVRKGVFGSEMWTEEMKKRIASAWDMDVYDIYGFTELCGPGVANDCYLHDGLHLWEDHFFVEVIDPKTGEPVGPEEKGELVFTTLTKEAAPVIRYRCRDISFLMDSHSCDCGRTHRKLGYIRGRVDDMIKVAGVAIWPSAVEAVLLKHGQLGPEYQIVIWREKGLDKLKVVAELAREMKRDEVENLRARLQEELHETLFIGAEVELVEPMTLPRQEIGKARRVVDKRAE
ncbi:MAG: phenylacetate--CoA ligase [Candidatus Caldarchaeum sp.]|nr:phenylacetate--CoA ligase [Candidatus Caldarchaeum sp.]MDW8435470.1 phenylacetate--CoA ligase [Candidatus Caldarchaeum sp.]